MATTAWRRRATVMVAAAVLVGGCSGSMRDRKMSGEKMSGDTMSGDAMMPADTRSGDTMMTGDKAPEDGTMLKDDAMTRDGMSMEKK
jgi:hypothetical protein